MTWWKDVGISKDILDGFLEDGLLFEAVQTLSFSFDAQLIIFIANEGSN